LSSTRRRISRSWFEMINKTEEEDKTSVEAHAYTPGLKVKRSMTVDKTRRLPIFGEVLVDAGGTVEHDTIVARTEISGDPEIVKVAMKLGVEAEDVPRYMKVKIGEAVEEGGQMAYYSALFGLIKKEVVSPIAGTIETISEITGQVIVRGKPVPIEIDSYIPGKVVQVLPRRESSSRRTRLSSRGSSGSAARATGGSGSRSSRPRTI